jgi:IPT/TIG domain
VPGRRVTIAGEDFGRDPAAVSVTFGGTPAQVSLALRRSITALVPALPAGPTEVVVTVAGRSSAPFSFEVLRTAPVITRVEPPAVRAGNPLSILGEGLQGDSVTVLADTLRLRPAAVTDSLISVAVPISLSPGRYAIQVERDGQLSNRITQTVDVFTVTGVYEVQARVLLNSCTSGPPVGSERTLGASVTDARPSIALDFGVALGLMQGILNANGSFNAAVTGTGTTISGRFGAPSGQAGFGGTLETRPPRCRIVEEVSGTRTSVAGALSAH